MQWGNTSLHRASEYGREAFAAYLLERGADAKATNQVRLCVSLDSPIHTLSAWMQFFDKFSIVKLWATASTTARFVELE